MHNPLDLWSLFSKVVKSGTRERDPVFHSHPSLPYPRCLLKVSPDCHPSIPLIEPFPLPGPSLPDFVSHPLQPTFGHVPEPPPSPHITTSLQPDSCQSVPLFVTNHPHPPPNVNRDPPCRTPIRLARSNSIHLSTHSILTLTLAAIPILTRLPHLIL